MKHVVNPVVIGALATLAALASVAAQAQTNPGADTAPTRASVTAELVRARAAGELDFALMPVLRERPPERAADRSALERRKASEPAPDTDVAAAGRPASANR